MRPSPGRQRAWLFSRLAQAEMAGLPLANALENLESAADSGQRETVGEFRRLALSGVAFADAGRLSGVFLPWESRLLTAAEHGGRLGSCLKQLAERHEHRARRVSRLRSAMVFPLLIAVLATFAGPLRGLLTGAMSGSQYLLLTLGRLILLFSGLWLLSLGVRRWAASDRETRLSRVLTGIPWLGRLIVTQQRSDYLFSLSLLLEAGVPAFEALDSAAKSVRLPHFRKQFGQASFHCRNGATMAEALLLTGTIDPDGSRGVIQAGEFAGRLEEMIGFHASEMEQRLNDQMDSLTTWAPRILYFVGLLLVVF